VRRTPKQNGTEAETAAATFLRDYFPGVCRLPASGQADVGDLGGIDELAVQVKAQHRMELAAWMDATAHQAARKGVPYFVVVHKRWRKGPGDWYVSLPLRVFAPLYAQLLRSRTTTH
jgi:hypothetical protein